MASEILGAANHRYEVVPNWGTLPSTVKLGYTHSVAVDAQGRVIIHNMSEHATIFFDGAGKYIKSWGKEFAQGAHGMQLRKEGNTEFLYFADISRKAVVKTTMDGKVVFSQGQPKEAGVYKEPGEYCPTNVAFAPNGDFYAADGYGKHFIHQYDINGKWIRTWGGQGSEPGKMISPHGIWCDTRDGKPKLVVADRENHRLQYFTLDGKHLSFVTEELRRPCHFHQRGDDLLIPDLCGRVTIFDKKNKLITHLGDQPGIWDTPGWPEIPREKWIPGKFSSPHGACWDHEGNIYVVEWIAVGRITKLRRLA